MSGIIQIAEKPPPWLIALRTFCVAAPLAGLLWYGLRDDDAPAPTQPVPPPPVAVVHRTPMGIAPTQPADTHEAATTIEAPALPAAVAGVDSDSEFATRNAKVDIRLLSMTRPLAARTFLTEVLLAPGSQGGFVVADVLADSRYERLGLRPGDVIYSLDTPQMAAVDESSMVSLMRQTEIELDVYRNGSLTRLHHSLASAPEEDTHAVNR